MSPVTLSQPCRPNISDYIQFQILTAMSTETKRHLATLNENLRAQHNNLKATKDYLLEHIGDLMRREKQMNKLKVEMIDELGRTQEQIKIEQKSKEPLCLFLKEELSLLDKQYIDGNLKLRNLENEYQVCLQDYERVIETVSSLLEGSSSNEGELSRLKESDITMKAMIFDCERLKRVLEEEKRYFKELCNSEAKSHVERVKELQSIRKNITQEEDSSTCSIRLSKLHLGFMNLMTFFDRRIDHYREVFIREETKEMRVVKLGTNILANCILTASFKVKQKMRGFFRLWNSNVFPRSVLKDISERALAFNQQSRVRLKILGAMSEKMHQNGTQMLNIYQKIKYIVAVANKHSRKDKHYGFNIWRENSMGSKRIANQLQQTFARVLPRHLLREYFKKWNKTANMIHRIDTATLLLADYENTKQVARVFRRWRFSILAHEQGQIRSYMRRLNQQQMIKKRLNYEKRKVKVLTTLHFKLTKIKLRNYFSKYWCNVKQFRVKEQNSAIEQQKQKISQMRKQSQKEESFYASKDKKLLVTIFRDFVYKCKIVPVYKQWRNDSQHFKKQKRAILTLILRKEAKNKIFVMNQFRKCVQYYEKKEMHQVLTDLNKKMENINEKSTEFRELLKNCIENLGVIASKKLDYVTNYAEGYQKKMLFNTYVAIKIKKAYKMFILARFMTILNGSCGRQTFSALQQHTRDHRKMQELDKKIDGFIDEVKKKQVSRIFYRLKRLARGHHQGFATMIHVENVFIFYRLANGLAAIKRKYTEQKYKAMQKTLQDQGNVLKGREQNMSSLQNTREGIEGDLQAFFVKFITYEDRKQKIKQREKTHEILKKYLTQFRAKVKTEIIREKTVQNLGDVISNKNMFVFFRNLMVIRYEQMMQELKEQLAKINAKRKTFEEKQSKIQTDMMRRIDQEIGVYTECKRYYEYYTKRFEDILRFFSRRTVESEEIYRKKQVFYQWKIEATAVKRITEGIESINKRKFITQPFQLLVTHVKGTKKKEKSGNLLGDIFLRKGERQMKSAIHLWKVNIRKQKQEVIAERLSHLDQYELQIKQELKERAALISNEVPKYNLKRLIVRTFMGFKQIWLAVQTNKRKIRAFQQKRQQGYVREAMNRWKWLMYYKNTKRAYLKYKQQKYDMQLKRDVFTSLKMHRDDIYTILNKMKAVNNNNQFKVSKFCFDKIRNEAANNRDQLNYERRRALTTLISAKISKIGIIKKKILAKWNAWLIPRTHYLPTILRRLQLSSLKKAFANINERKYWNDYYIKNIADEVTSSGYSDINSITNSLMREGYDPDEIKDYLKTRNDKDMAIMDKVIKHFKRWAQKESAVRAFHSWKQYLGIKQNIKKSLAKVFNIAGGIGKYFSRWRSKDVHFNEMLKKESRGNMLLRYKELSRLLKEYHRDIRDNAVNLDELKDINREYKSKNRMGVLMALNCFSNSCKKGLRQGLFLWKDHVKAQRRAQIDERYDQMIQGIEMLSEQRGKSRYRIGVLRQENKQLKQKCMWGVECGKILQRLLTEKDSLSIDLADKEHNLKLLLEDNLRLKQKMKIAISHAQKLIRKVDE